MNEIDFPGGELTRRREALGLSVDDVYRKMRIPHECVEAFESGDLERLPIETYAVGFLKTYCEFLDIDPAPWLDRLRDYRELAALEARPTVRESLSGRPKWIRDAFAWTAVCAVLAIAWIAYTIVVQPGAPEKEGQVQAETTTLDADELSVPELPNRDR